MRRVVQSTQLVQEYEEIVRYYLPNLAILLVSGSPPLFRLDNVLLKLIQVLDEHCEYASF